MSILISNFEQFSTLGFGVKKSSRVIQVIWFLTFFSEARRGVFGPMLAQFGAHLGYIWARKPYLSDATVAPSLIYRSGPYPRPTSGNLLDKPHCNQMQHSARLIEGLFQARTKSFSRVMPVDTDDELIRKSELPHRQLTMSTYTPPDK